MLDLLRPFSFLFISHPSQLPLRVNWLLPLFLALAAMASLALLDGKVNVYGPQGLFDRILGLVQTLAGFYIAALAAVSSFNSPHLDREMPSPAPTLYVRYNGGMEEVKATRRRFLTSMFAYLTALSLLISLTLITTLVLADPIKMNFPNASVYLHWLGSCVLLFFLFQMMSVTFWGLFYLGERMLTPD